MKSQYKIAETVTPSKLYETNYYKILLLFPQLDNKQKPLENTTIECRDKSLQIHVKEQHKYTTIARLYKRLPINKTISQLDMVLRLYHDARLIEVIAFQGSKKLKKYENYPNKDMYLVDEKKQLNFHLQSILNMGLNEDIRNSDLILAS
ncbi:MAG: DUF1249 domain-containing protein [Pseudomonadota bacterium]